MRVGAGQLRSSAVGAPRTWRSRAPRGGERGGRKAQFDGPPAGDGTGPAGGGGIGPPWGRAAALRAERGVGATTNAAIERCHIAFCELGPVVGAVEGVITEVRTVCGGRERATSLETARPPPIALPTPVSSTSSATLVLRRGRGEVAVASKCADRSLCAITTTVRASFVIAPSSRQAGRVRWGIDVVVMSPYSKILGTLNRQRMLLSSLVNLTDYSAT